MKTDITGNLMINNFLFKQSFEINFLIGLRECNHRNPFRLPYRYGISILNLI
jgi:hypothetical protein